MSSGNPSQRVNQKVLFSSVICTSLYTVIALVIGFLTASQVILFDGIFNLVGLALTYLSIFSVRFIKKPDMANYPFGKEAFEPFIALIQYGVILYICATNIVTAVNTILHGGHVIDLLSGVAFGLFGTVFNLLVFGYLKYLTKQHTSAISEVEVAQWKFSCYLSIGILSGFALSMLLDLTAWSGLTAYVDPVLTMAITVLFSKTAIISIKSCLRELLGAKPTDEVVALITEKLNDATDMLPIQDRVLRFGKVGEKVIIEIDYIIESGSPLDGVACQDQLRKKLVESLRQLPHELWVNVTFIGDENLASHYVSR